MLIDATMNLDYDPDPDLGGARFPPKVWPTNSDVAAVARRWSEFGLKPLPGKWGSTCVVSAVPSPRPLGGRGRRASARR